MVGASSVKENSSKTVVLIGWDYTFIEPDSKQETHHQFYNKIKIKQGQNKEVSAPIAKPPMRTISAKEGEKVKKGEVKINYIEYEDGTVWGQR